MRKEVVDEIQNHLNKVRNHINAANDEINRIQRLIDKDKEINLD